MNLRYSVAAVVMGMIYVLFAFKKASLGVDFTDEGLYVVAPMRLALGEPLFSSEIVTLIRPFEIISRLFFHLFDSPTLYELRLCGWVIHIFAYLVFSWLLYREFGSLLISFLASALSFFISFAWPATIATPSYKSLSTDFLLLFLCCYFATQRWPALRPIVLRVCAGLSLFVATVCYPPLVIIFLATCAYDLWSWRRLSGSPWRDRSMVVVTSLTGVVAGLLVLGWLWNTGALALWVERIPLTQSFSLTAVKSGGLSFFGHLFTDLLTKIVGFTRYSSVVGILLVFLLIAKKDFLNRWRPVVFTAFLFYSLYLLVSQYHGPLYTDHFFFPTAYCLIALAFIVVYTVIEVRLALPTDPAALFCIFLSLTGTLLYATSTYFFDYYYSWNNGLLGLPFAFSFVLARISTLAVGNSKWRLPIVSLALAIATLVAGAYNLHGVRRDEEVPKLTATFQIPPLHGIRSAPDRVKAVELLYNYLEPLIAHDRRLLIFDDAPMLYFIFNAKPTYGLAWAIRDGIAPEARKKLAQEFLAKPLPKYAIRTLVKLKFPDWKSAEAQFYDDSYPLNLAVSRLYQLDRIIYPFEVFVLREQARPAR
jgi:hypothetical protein